MVKERSPSRTSSSQPISPQRAERQPLANISAKMQSPSSKPTSKRDGEQKLERISQAAGQPEFGKASPLRNPLKKRTPDPFIHKRPTVQAKPPSQRQEAIQPSLPLQRLVAASSRSAETPQPSSSSSTASQTNTSGFYLPGRKPLDGRGQTQQSSAPVAQSTIKQPARQTEPFLIKPPTNPTYPTTQPPPRPTFSSIGPKTYYQAWAPPKPVIDLTKSKKDDDDDYDPDAEIRAESNTFGAVDPYMYVDSAQANENIKNLLEGAFDDEEKSRTRLRSRAKKTESKPVEIKSLADKLAALNVKDDTKDDTAAVEDEEEEDGTVEGMTIKLLPHQVEGVSWMIDKEIGIRKKNQVLPKGGVLADDMGLGKTVQSVALMLTNPRPGDDTKPEHPKQQLPGKEVAKGTLVVAPLALIKQWESEIKTKVSRSHALKVLVHHGPSRTKSAAELKKYDVVITTYQILASEHAGSNMDAPGGAKIGCMGVHWYRIMLDEAHSIKNRNAKSTLACCAVQSWYRWCLTGTPMQNNLEELQSLIKFLRIKPFSDLSEWKDKISGPMKNGRGALAMKRLQYFLKAFMKRRTKDILKKEGALNFGGKKVVKEGEENEKQEGMRIVKREIITMECDFDAAELEFYDRLQSRAETRLNHMMEAGGKTDYIGALVLLLRLRQACNHPQLIEMAMSKDKDAMTIGSGLTGNGLQTPRKGSRVDDDEMDDLAALMGGVSVQTRSCDVCQVELSDSEARGSAVRCVDCENDIRAMKQRSKTSKSRARNQDRKEAKPKPSTQLMKSRPMRNRRVLEDSDDEGEGEWIADGPEGKIDLGRAGGTDDEDAEGGGETLGSIDSVTDDDEETTTYKTRPQELGSQDSVDTRSEGSDSDSDSPILTGFAPSHKPKHAPSTKIRHMLRILHREMAEHKTIIFSQFTSMLDIMEPHLRHAQVRFVRYDGSMKPDAREASLSALRNDSKTRVLLCSLKCGSLGLNLTAASRVIILEPFWNPFVEEQAIDRVHRLNQTVDVKVYRLTVRNTVEEKILALQEKKRQLANAAIESGSGKGIGKLSMADIMGLFRRDAEVDHEAGDETLFAPRAGNLLEPSTTGVRGSSSQRAAEAGADSSRRVKDTKGKSRQEHEVYGRRW